MLKCALLRDLNDGQRKAVLHREGPMLVTAGPGSGKTHVITTRLLIMIHVYQIPPEKIMVITFTKDAARSMCSRFLMTYQQDCSIAFGTFHSFYYQIIRSIPQYSKYRLIHEKEKKYILSMTISVSDPDEKEDLIDHLLRAISFYKNTEDMTKATEISSLQRDVFRKYMICYEQEKHKRKVMDFDDMLFLCMKLLQNDNCLLKYWQERFAYYLVDEFQDCNPIQYRILRMLAGRNLFVVGDDDQAIYGFRGADSQILQKFAVDYPNAEHVVMGINYRCGAQIVKASSMVIRDNKMRMDKSLTASKLPTEEEYVHIRKWKDKTEMIQYIKDLFKEIPEKQMTDHALLLRTNMEVQMFAVELLKNNISFRMKDKNLSIYEHFLIKDILAFLEAANGNRERKLFLRILNKPRRHIGREALEDETIDLKKIKAFYQDPYMCNPAAVKDVEELERHLTQLKKLPIGLGIRYIRKAMGYEKYLIKRAEGNAGLLTDWIDLLDWLQEDGNSFNSLQEWKEYQEEYKCVQSNNVKNTGVHILTMHASKGLEFEHCYILNVNDGMIPKYQKGQKLTAEQLEEERRIFYVGMTRAKKTLELHYLTGTKERPKFPSRFIQNLLKT